MHRNIVSDNPNIKFMYDYWQGKISYLFFLLSIKITHLFPLHECFPIDLIKYILILYLKYDQQLLIFDRQCPCYEKQCIINWWKYSYINIDKYTEDKIYYYYYSPKHCNGKNCHKFIDPREISNKPLVQIHDNHARCNRCHKEICESCCAIIQCQNKYQKIDWQNSDSSFMFVICNGCYIKELHENTEIVNQGKLKCSKCDKYYHRFDLKPCRVCKTIICDFHYTLPFNGGLKYFCSLGCKKFCE